jgi:hypothetical protein
VECRNVEARENQHHGGLFLVAYKGTALLALRNFGESSELRELRRERIRHVSAF